MPAKPGCDAYNIRLLGVECPGKTHDDVDRKPKPEQSSKPVLSMPRLFVGPHPERQVEDRQDQPVAGAVGETTRNARQERDDQRRIGELDDREARGPLPSHHAPDRCWPTSHSLRR